MFKQVIAWIVSAVQAVLLWVGLPVTPKGQPLDLNKFELTWQDEFDGSSLDLNKWEGHYFWDGYGKRRDGYWTLEMARVADGMLHIQSAYSEEGMSGGPPGYYSVGIDTNHLFLQKFGYFEVRCQLPKGEGLWSAFWMFNDMVGNEDGSGKDGSEIDIFESPYYTQKRKLFRDRITTNIHYDGYEAAHKTKNVGKYRVKDPYNNFHTYGMEWNEKEYIFYIDGVESGRSSFGGVSQNEQFLILSVEQEAGGWAGDVRNNKPGDMTDFVVDYVRAYQYK